MCLNNRIIPRARGRVETPSRASSPSRSRQIAGIRRVVESRFCCRCCQGICFANMALRGDPCNCHRSFYEAPLEASRQTRVISSNPPAEVAEGARQGQKRGGTRYPRKGAFSTREGGRGGEAREEGRRSAGGGGNAGGVGRNPQVLDMRRATGGPLLRS